MIARSLTVLVVFGAIAACSGQDITVATVPAMDAQAPLRCTVPGDCPDGTFCERAACGDAAGTCALFPIQCGNTEAPVCGCDGITYMDDCLRRSAGVSASTPGPCRLENAVTCRGGQPCPGGSLCARLLGLAGPCNPDPLGTCWVVPAVCPIAPTPNRWDSCAPMPSPRCLDTCTAIASGGVYRRAGPCM
jgi:hypothetical protein